MIPEYLQYAHVISRYAFIDGARIEVPFNAPLDYPFRNLGKNRYTPPGSSVTRAKGKRTCKRCAGNEWEGVKFSSMKGLICDKCHAKSHAASMKKKTEYMREYYRARRAKK